MTQFSLTEDQIAIRDMAQSFAAENLAPKAVEWDQTKFFPVDVLRERIERRGIKYEQSIERGYLERLQETYARFFHAYDASPLLIVNAAQADFVNSEHDYAQLLEQVLRIRRGRHYYNPLKSAV